MTPSWKPDAFPLCSFPARINRMLTTRKGTASSTEYITLIVNICHTNANVIQQITTRLIIFVSYKFKHIGNYKHQALELLVVSEITYLGEYCIDHLSRFTWWRHQMETFLRYWPFVRRIHRWPVNSPHKGQWTRLNWMWFLSWNFCCTHKFCISNLPVTEL